MANEASELPEEETQISAFPPRPDEAPPGSISPPGNDAFDNATHMRAGPEIMQLIGEVLEFDELADLSGKNWTAIWRKKSHPKMPDGSPRFVTAGAVSPLWRWLTEGAYEFLVHLHWSNFDDLRDESQFVHPLTFQQHAHFALLGLAVTEEGNVVAGGAPTLMYPESVKRFGAWTPGMAAIKNQLELWPRSDE